MNETITNGTQALFSNVWCVYPISGTYTRAQRVLFYVAIIIAFAFRFHKRLFAVAFSYVAVYLFVTIVHAIPMALQPSLGADPDFFAIRSLILTASGCSFMAASYSLRYLQSKSINFYICWFIVGAITNWIFLFRELRFLSSIEDSVFQQACLPSIQCPDPCADLHVNAMFRGSGDRMLGVVLEKWQDMLGGDYGNTPIGVPVIPDIPGHVVRYCPAISIPVLIVLIVVVRPLFVLRQWNDERPPRRSRNAFFKRLMHRRVLRTPGRGFLQLLQFYAVYYLHVCWEVLDFLLPELTLLILFMGMGGWGESWIYHRSCLKPCDSRRHTQMSKYLSFSWYLCNMLAYIFSPAMIIYNISIYELHWLARIPESEELSAIGQWGPIVGFVATFLIAYLVQILWPQSPTNSRDKMENVNQDPLAHNMQPRATFLGVISVEWKDLMEWWRDPCQVSIKDEGLPETERESVQRPGLTDDETSQLRLRRLERHCTF